MDAIDNVKYGFKIFSEKWLAFAAATLIAIVGSMLVITAPPLWFGLYYMVVKAMRGEKPEIGDVFKGFQYFKTSWVYIILVCLIVVALYLPGFLVMVLGSGKLGGLLLFIAMLAILVFSLTQVYAIPLMVGMNIGVVDAIKKSVEVFKQNLATTIIMGIVVGVLSWILSLIVVGSIVMPTISAAAFTKVALKPQPTVVE